MVNWNIPESLKNLPSMNLMPQKVEKIELILAEELQHYEGHAFTLYQGERRKDMIQSIKENGILMPLIVRPKGMHYEIIAGHNRYDCGMEADLKEFPCIVRELSDEEAELIVMITNLHQRGLSDMPHSEKAKVIKIYYEAVKAQGKRNDMVSEVKTLLENAEKADDIKENSTSCQVGKKLNGAEKTVNEYGLSARTIGRYLRIAKLNRDFLELLDDGKLSMVAAVDLSYLTDDEQQLVYGYITDNDQKIDMKKAKAIRQLSQQKKLNEFSLPSVWEAKTKAKPKDGNTIRLKRKNFEEYFQATDTAEEIEEVIRKALVFYFENFDEKNTEE